MANPWDLWAPGVLNKPQMAMLLEEGYITHGGRTPKLGHSSMDLSLTNEGFEMPTGSVKPSEAPYDSYTYITRRTGLAKPHPALADGTFLLQRRKTYVFRLHEKLETQLRQSEVIYGQATAKSSVGRVDVLARLIVDGMKTYECFDPDGLLKGSGDMYLEITPITFDVRVKPNTSLSQLRLFYGKPEDVVVHSKQIFNTIFRDTAHSDESLTVNLSDAKIAGPDSSPVIGIAFRSKNQGDQCVPVPLWKDSSTAKAKPIDYWDVETADEYKRLPIRPGTFYILRSKEKLYVPKGIAIYCRASDETMGEMRIHYAGFVHPYFGLYREDRTQGTPLIFEVRGHEVSVSLADKEKMATLIFYRMSEDAPKLTEKEEADEADGYGSQDLKLSTFFESWPESTIANGVSIAEIAKKGDTDGTGETT